jgi:MFS family permease
MLAQMGTPFFAVYASRELGAGAEMVSVYLAAFTTMFLLSNIVWSRLSERRGNCLVIRLSAGMGLGMALMAWLAGPLNLALALGAAAPWLFVVVFALSGAFQSAINLAGNSLILEMAPPHDRALYIGLTNTVLGVALLSTALGGVIVDAVGYRGLFLMTVGLFAGGLWATILLHDPRRTAV